MFGLIHPMKPVKKAVGGEGGALMPFGFSPWRRSLFPEFGRVFDGFLRDWELPVVGEKAWRWDVEVEEKPEEVVVRAEAPGFKPGDFEVEVRDELLVLHAAREKTPKRKEKEKREDEKAEYAREEFYKIMALPGPVSAEKAAARYVHGVLTVTLPKAEEARGRRVPVTTA
jgi:HSP20 family protein